MVWVPTVVACFADLMLSYVRASLAPWLLPWSTYSSGGSVLEGGAHSAASWSLLSPWALRVLASALGFLTRVTGVLGFALAFAATAAMVWRAGGSGARTLHLRLGRVTGFALAALLLFIIVAAGGALFLYRVLPQELWSGGRFVERTVVLLLATWPLNALLVWLLTPIACWAVLDVRLGVEAKRTARIAVLVASVACAAVTLVALFLPQQRSSDLLLAWFRSGIITVFVCLPYAPLFVALALIAGDEPSEIASEASVVAELG